MEEYHIFAPPEELAQKDILIWTPDEAHSYKNWLEGVLEERTDRMIGLLDVHPKKKPEPHLSAIGKKAELLFLSNPNFTQIQDTEKVLSSRGYALAADMGLLVARYLLKVEGVKWTIDTRSKTYAFFNIPVLQCGPGKLGHFDPIGCSIGDVYGILKNLETSECWKNVYLECRKDALMSNPKK